MHAIGESVRLNNSGSDQGRALRRSAQPVVGATLAESAVLSLRIDFDPGRRIGPGKIELLERIAGCGSISQAARQMNMSYLRAWKLVEEMDAILGRTVVNRKVGGSHGGGTKLTRLGDALVARFRAVERAAAEVAQDHLAALQREIERQDEDPAEGG